MKNRNTSVKLKAFVNAVGNFAHNRPTRITQHTQTLLDVTLVSPNCSVSNSGVIHRAISDHSIGFAKLKIKKQKTVPQYVTTRSYKHYNGNQFACDLAKEADALLTTFDKPGVDSKLENLMDTLQHTLDSHAPQKQIKIRGRPCPFVNKEIKDMMKFRDILLKTFVQTREIRPCDTIATSSELAPCSRTITI